MEHHSMKKDPPAVLAVTILKATGAHEELPPAAFARITCWSHGKASIDTGNCSEWETCEPVLLPIDLAHGGWNRAIELKVSLWEKTRGKPCVMSKMFGGVAGVSLPSPEDLGVSGSRAKTRTFPSEEDDFGVGRLALRAWIVSPEAPQMQSDSTSEELHDSGGELSMRDTRRVSNLTLGTNGASTTTKDTLDDDDLIFALSESSEDASTPRRMSKRRETLGSSTGSLTSTEIKSNALAGNQVNVLDVSPPKILWQKYVGNHGIKSANTFVDVAGDAVESDTQVREEPAFRSSQASSRQTSDENAADLWVEALPQELRNESEPSADDTIMSPLPREITRMPGDSAHKDQQASTCHPGRLPLPLSDEATSTAENGDVNEKRLGCNPIMPPLIPSYRPWSAKIVLWVHGVRLPVGVMLKSPPYVRVSLPPGAHSIACTGPALGPTLIPATSKPNIWKRYEGKFPTPRPEPALRYRFISVGGGGARLILPLGSDALRFFSEINSSPILRVEVVSCRSMGRCDVSLVEALRHPGRVFRHLDLPVWKDVSQHQKKGRKYVILSSKVISDKCSGQNSTAGEKRKRDIAGRVLFDFGVMLTEDYEDLSPQDSNSAPLAASFVTVDAIAVRTSCTKESELGCVVAGLSETTGLSVELSLAGEMKHITFSTSDTARANEEGEEMASEVHHEMRGNGVVLKSTCTELDSVVLRLIQSDEGTPLAGTCSTNILSLAIPNRGNLKGEALMIPVSDINNIFGGRARWVAINYLVGKDGRAGSDDGNQGGTLEQTYDSFKSWKVRLKMVRAAVDPTRQLSNEKVPSTGRRCVKEPAFCLDSSRRFSDPCIQQAIPQNINTSGSSTPCSFFQAYEACAQNHSSAQARAIFSSPGHTKKPPTGDTVFRGSPEYGNSSTNQEFVIFELEVVALHFSLKRTTTSGGIIAEDVTSDACSSWRVHAAFSEGNQGFFTIDSLPGVLEKKVMLDPQGAEGDSLKDSGVMRWTLGTGMRARFAVHWTPRQKAIPMVFFTVFQGKILTARSALELPPIIMHTDQGLSFLHPCSRPPGGVDGCYSNHDTEILLELRCVAASLTDKRVTEQYFKRDKQSEPPALRVPRSQVKTPNQQKGGFLCIQICAVRRIRRALRGRLALPFTVLFSLPRDAVNALNGESIGVGWGGGDKRTGPKESYLGASKGVCWKECAGIDGDGKVADVACLRVEPCREGSAMVLATLVGAEEVCAAGRSRPTNGYVFGDGRSSCNKRPAVGTTWFPVSDDVMKNGRLADGWYPLRVGNSSSKAKACELRLRLHFMPDLNSAVASTNLPLPKKGNPNDQALTVVLEEGRELSHPDLRTGPRELFAEVFVDYQEEQGLGKQRSWDDRGDPSTPLEMAIGPLPLRENTPRGGSNGTGSSPCWNHRLRVPLCTALTEGTYEAVDTKQPTADRVNGLDRRPFAKPLLTVVIKSAARRVEDCIPSPASWSLSHSAPDMLASQRKTVVESCLVIGIARIRLPFDMLRSGNENKRTPIRGWYTVKADDCGAHRGQVKLSVYPINWSGLDANHHNQQEACSSGPAYPSVQAGSLRRPFSLPESSTVPRNPVVCQTSSADRTGLRVTGSVSDSSSEQSDQAAMVLRLAGGIPRHDSEGDGLLFVSVSDLSVRASKPPADKNAESRSSLAEAFVSLRCRHQEVKRPQNTSAALASLGEPSQPPSTNSRAATNGSQHMAEVLCSRGARQGIDDVTLSSPSIAKSYRRCSNTMSDGVLRGRLQIESCLTLEGDRMDSNSTRPGGSRLGVVLAVDHCKPGRHLALYIWVSAKFSQWSRVAYHGVLNLSSCLSNVGIEVQENKDLTRTKKSPSKSNSTNGTTNASPSSSDRTAEGGHGADSFCTVNVTTTFISHKSGALSVDLSQLRLTPPSPKDMEQLRALTELRDQTASGAHGSTLNSLAREAQGSAAEGGAQRLAHNPIRVKARVFIRIRVSPSGLWAFSPVFEVEWPRPADWGRDPVNAGTSIPAVAILISRSQRSAPLQGITRLPEGAHISFEIDTSVHSSLRREPPPPKGEHSCRRSMINCGADSGGAVEPLSLEVCLFDNRSSAWSCLLGRGVLPLTPVIIADTAHSKIERAVKPSGVSKEQKLGLSGVTREVVLLEPRTGKMMATVPLELEFTPRDKSAPESTASEESRVQVDGELGDSCKFLRKTAEASKVAWALKSIFCNLDPTKTGAVLASDLLAAVAKESSTIGAPPMPPMGLSGGGCGGDKGDQGVFFFEDQCRVLGLTGGESGDDSVVELVRFFLNSIRGARDGGSVSWEEWAAISESFCHVRDVEQISLVQLRLAEIQPQALFPSNGSLASFNTLAESLPRHQESKANLLRKPKAVSVPTPAKKILHHTVAETRLVQPRGRPQSTRGTPSRIERFSTCCGASIASFFGKLENGAISFPNSARDMRRPVTSLPANSKHSTTSSAVTTRRPATAEHIQSKKVLEYEFKDETCKQDEHPGRPEERARVGVFVGQGCAQDTMVHETATRELELGIMETKSAIRKASKFKTCMLEAQVALEKEQERVVALSARVLDGERKLLQRDRIHIREAARTRARFLELEVDRARINERRMKKEARARAENGAAAIIQRIVEGFLQKRRYKEELASIKALQRAGRFLLVVKRYWQYRLQRRLAALLIQRIQRGRLARVLLAARTALLTKAQALIRGGLQRRRVRVELQAHLMRRRGAAKVLQADCRRFVSRRAYLELRASSVMVQSSQRRRLVYKEVAQRRHSIRVLQRTASLYILNAHRRKSVRLLQRAYRLSVREKKAYRERQAIFAAARLLQHTARRWATRCALLVVLEARRRNRAVAVIRRSLRGHIMKTRLYRHRLAAAITLQRVVGRFFVKLVRLRRRQKVMAVIAIQVLYRDYKSRMRMPALVSERQKSALRILDSFRERRKVSTKSREQRREVSALVLQRAWVRAWRKNHRNMKNPASEHSPFAVVPSTLSTERGLAEACATPNIPADIEQRLHGNRATFVPRAVTKSPGACDDADGGLRTTEEYSNRKVQYLQKGPATGEIQNMSSESAKYMRQKRQTNGNRRDSRCSKLRSAVEAVACRMARNGVVIPDDTGGLWRILNLENDDPELRAELQQNILKVEARIACSIRRVADRGGGRGGVIHFGVVAGFFAEEELQRSLMVLKRRIALPSE